MNDDFPDDRRVASTVTDLSADTIRQLRDLPKCAHCGGWHLRACPRIKRMAFAPGGELIEVEFWEKWPDHHVLWPDELTPADSGDSEGG